MASKKTKDLEEGLEAAASEPRRPRVDVGNSLPSGLTLLNLGLSGSIDGGIPPGTVIWFVGGTSSGKTWFILQLMAEAHRLKRFDGYRFVHDNPENGALMDVDYYFGRGMSERIEPPAKDIVGSGTIEEVFYNIDANLDRGPCIIGVDSVDAVGCKAWEDAFEAERKRYEEGEGKVPGSMGMEKAKVISKNIGRVQRRLAETGSILVLISQTRDLIGGMYPGQQTHSGGQALRFYNSVRVWTKVKEDILKPHGGKNRVIGHRIEMDLQKNRITGRDVKIEVPFVIGYGFDEIGSMVDYLVDENHWKAVKEKGKPEKVIAPEFDFEGPREKLIALIEKEGEEREVRLLVRDTWRKIEEAVTPVRKARYE